MTMPDRYGLPRQAVAVRRFDRAAASFDAADGLLAEARSRLLERLDLFGLAPAAIVDLGAATGAAGAALAARFPRARIVAADLSAAMLRRARASRPIEPEAAYLRCDAHALPLREGSIDLVFANLLLPWTLPDRVFAECARVLKAGGLALFTTLGPDTLLELRRAWAAVDDRIHVHGFVDMHDVGDLAARAGLSEPVIDVDRLTVSYPSLGALVAELRASGMTNSALGGPEGLTTPARWRAFEAAFRDQAGSARPAVTVELVFAQAWGTGGGRPAADGVVRIGAEELARAARSRRAPER